jgi:hypothetical protein
MIQATTGGEMVQDQVEKDFKHKKMILIFTGQMKN